MAKKKYKKRQHSPAVAAKRQVEQEKLADEKARSGKRFNPVARALLLTDLVFLAVVSILSPSYQGIGLGVISQEASAVCTLAGVVLLIAALWFQFGPKDRKGFGKGPRL